MSKGAMDGGSTNVYGRTVYGGPKDGVHLSGEYGLSGLMPI